MGEVWLAEDTQLERSVALKIMSPQLARDENQRKRFRTEAKAASALGHPNICVIHEVGEAEDGRPFLAMEYLEGQTLDAIEQQRHLRVREVVDVGIDVAEALQAAHSRRIIHRDIKPSNIMLDARGHSKVLDFGLAKSVAHEELGAATTSGAQTRTGFLIGTPYYMSPEQVLGRELDARSDLFSLGVVLYELLAGQRPFLGRTVGEVINNIVNQQPEPLGLENPLFSPALDAIVFKCLEKDPQNRYVSAKVLVGELKHLRDQASAARTQSVAVAAVPKDQPAVVAEPAKEPAARPAKRVLRFAALAGVLLAGATLLTLLVIHSLPAPRSGSGPVRSQAVAAQKSVAVLPFDNFSGEPDTDYLSDGLTEEITTALSRLPGLKVAARTSSFALKGKKEDARKVGELLHVATLLEGSIRKVGNQIRVTAQLVNAADGLHLWSETYDRSINDILGVQEDIARRIAERLQADNAGVRAKQQTVSPEAYKAYLQAKLYWNKRTEAGLRKAIDLYQRAIELEPTYAAAHAGLAASYLLLPEYSAGTARVSEYRPRARASANRALGLDSTCAEAHAVLGSLKEHEPGQKGAEEHFRRALEFEPNNATAHHWYGLYLQTSGRRDEGLRELQKAIDLDPLSPIIYATIPGWYYLARDYDRAISEARRVIETFPDFPAARHGLIAPEIQKGLYKEALVEIEKARNLQSEQPLALLDAKGFCLARMGRESEARAIIAELEQQRKEGRPVEGAMAYIYHGLRDEDKACALLEQVRQTEGLDQLILCDPTFDEARRLPQFQALLSRAGLTNAPTL